MIKVTAVLLIQIQLHILSLFEVKFDYDRSRKYTNYKNTQIQISKVHKYKRLHCRLSLGLVVKMKTLNVQGPC